MKRIVTGASPRHVVIMRGLPGSGKSHVAKALRNAMGDRGLSAVVCSADDFFVSDSGRYEWAHSKLVRDRVCRRGELTVLDGRGCQ